jgi:hypothetical protein
MACENRAIMNRIMTRRRAGFHPEWAPAYYGPS